MTQLLTIKELAPILKSSEKNIYKMVSERRIPVVRIGGSLRFSEKEIENWMAKRTIKEKNL